MFPEIVWCRTTYKAANPRRASNFSRRNYFSFNDQESKGDLWEFLVGQKDLHIIHLKRDNKIQTVLSRAISGNTGVWTSKVPGSRSTLDTRKVNLEISATVQELEQTKEWETEFAEKFAFHASIDIYYERLVSDPKEYKKLTNFLKLPYIAPTIALKRLNPEPMSHLISNYDELKASLAGSEWEKYVD